MEDTIVLADQNSNEFTFNKRLVDASGAIFWQSPSPRGDLAGVKVLKRAAMKTRAGIVGRTAHLTLPWYNTATGKYEGSVQVRVVVNAPSFVPLADVEVGMALMQGALGNTEFLANLVSAI